LGVVREIVRWFVKAHPDGIAVSEASTSGDVFIHLSGERGDHTRYFLHAMMLDGLLGNAAELIEERTSLGEFPIPIIELLDLSKKTYAKLPQLLRVGNFGRFWREWWRLLFLHTVLMMYLDQYSDKETKEFTELLAREVAWIRPEDAQYALDALVLGESQGYCDWKADSDPPKRVRRTAQHMLRAQRRQTERGEATRVCGSLEPTSMHLGEFASKVIVARDFESACAHLDVTVDQKRILELRFEGLSFLEAANFLGWDPQRLQAVKRSLGQDRSPGRELRDWLAPYRYPPDRR
jgi:hypothetical protein